jgi:hypothetical protein
VKQLRVYFAWVTVVTLVSSTTGLEGCGSKDAAPAAQQQAAPAAQTSDQGAQQGQPTPASSQQTEQAGATTQNQQQAELPDVNLTAAGLDELLAPIALYPDPVLAIMLQASVNPQEVMDGGNWLVQGDNDKLKEAALDEATKKAGFTPVMQALLHFGPVVDMMCVQFDWTKQLGAAYAADPKAVLDSVQRLRAQAVDNGALKSSPQMKVEVKQDKGQEVVQLEPTNPKVIYVPQYNPEQVFKTTTVTTTSGGTTTTTTTTSGPAPTSTSTNTTTVVEKEKEGVSTGTAVMIGLLSFGAGMAVGAAINSNNYYYPAWGYGGVWYGPRPYYPPPYHPIYYPGYRGGYYYNRPVHYGNTNIYVNNNYYNRFNNNNNLNPNYKPRPVPYNSQPGSTYAKSMGNQPGANRGVTYQGGAGNKAGPTTYQGAKPGQGNVGSRPGGGAAVQQSASGGNWKGQTTYQGANKGGGNLANNNAQRSGGANAGANNRIATTNNMPSRNPGGGDRGYPQTNARPSMGSGNTQASRPSTQQVNRPTTQQMSRPTAQPATTQSGGAFGGANNASADRAASNRGRSSMGAQQPQRSGGSGARQGQTGQRRK